MIPTWSGARASLRRYAHTRVTLVYAALGALWILVSDHVLAWFASGLDDFARWQTWKGWAFVGVTTLVLYGLIERVLTVLSEASATVREQHRTLTTLLGNLPGVVYRHAADEHARLEFVSEGGRSVLGLVQTGSLTQPRSRFEFVHEEDQGMVRARLAEALRSGQPFEIGYRIRTAAGAIRFVLDHGSVVTGEGAQVVEGYLFDVTERRLLEERLRRGQRMESLGRMAGSIAHDFNNVVFSVCAGCELLLQEAVTAHMRLLVQQIASAGESARRLVAQLMKFARQEEQRPVALQVNDALRHAEPMLRRLCGQRAKLSASLAAELDPVLADPSQIEQILINLVANAADAMPPGPARGEIRLATETRTVDGEQAIEADVQRGVYVCIRVEDTGVGIPESVLPHIFEPFFSTKQSEHGTGLGLSTVYGIVRQSGGGLLVRSECGRGTVFEVLLPALRESQVVSMAEAERPAALA